MNKHLKQALILGVIGFVCGTMISVIMFFAGDGGEFTIGSIPKLLLGGVFGAIPMGGSIVYDIDSWSIARATIVHFVGTFAGFFLLAIAQGWFEPGDSFFWIWTAAWVFAYFIIWLIQYMIYHRKVKEMNEELRKIHKR